MRLALSLLAILFLGVAATAQNAQKLNQGKELLRLKNYTAAAKVYQQVLDTDPTNVDALSGAIASFAYLKKLKDLQPAIDKAISAKPHNADIMVLKGKYLGLRDQYAEAIEVFKEALSYANNTQKSTIYSNIASLENQLNKPEEALLDAQKAISFNDKNADAHASLGYAQYSLKNYQEAVDSYSLAIVIDSENSVTFLNRGMAYYKMSDKVNSCADFQRACKLSNKNACVQYGTECVK